MAIIRPLEVLAEEWLALRKAGVKTPAIAAWPTAACLFAADPRESDATQQRKRIAQVRLAKSFH